MAREYRLERDRLDNIEQRKNDQQSDLFSEYWFKQRKQTKQETIIEEQRKMNRVLMIGAGGVATVAAFKIAQNADVFSEFMIASRRKEKCDACQRL